MFTRRSIVILSCCALFLPGCGKDPELAKREHVQRGDRYAAEGKHREAIIEYRQAIALDERFGEARAKLGDAYLRENDAQRALREYVRAADVMDDPGVQMKAGNLLLLAGNFEDAKGRADKVLARSPGHVDALVLRGTALAGLHDVDAAIEEVEAAIAADPARATSYSALATLQQAKGDVVSAEKSFLAGVKSDPKSTAAQLALANFYWRTRRPEAADTALRAAMTLAPRDPVVNRFAAAFYVASGRMAEAEQPLKTLAQDLPGVDARLRLVDYYVSTGRADAANKELEALAAEPAGFSAARLRLAKMALARGDRAGADRLVTELLQKNPKDAQALAAQAELRLAENKTDDALQAAQAAVAANANVANVHFVHGQVLSSIGEAERAETAFQEALRLNPRFHGAIVELSKVKLALGKAEHAAQLAESALKATPNHRDAQLVLVRSYVQLGRLDDAERALATLRSSAPEAPAVHTEFGRLLMTRKENGRARQAFVRALDRNPAYVPALQGLTALDLADKRHGDARARIEKAVADNPKDAALRILAGRIYRASGDQAAAEEALKQAIALNPNSMQAFVELAGFYAGQKRLPDATRELEKLQQRRPADVGVRTALGLLLELQNRRDEAEPHYLAALEADPRAAVAANNLAWMYAERGQKLETALQLAQLAKAQLPDEPEVNDTLGWVYYKNNMPALAVEPFREALKKDADNASYHLHLGMAYAKAGEPVKARASVERALTINPQVAGADEARAALAAVGQRLSR